MFIAFINDISTSIRAIIHGPLVQISSGMEIKGVVLILRQKTVNIKQTVMRYTLTRLNNMHKSLNDAAFYFLRAGDI